MARAIGLVGHALEQGERPIACEIWLRVDDEPVCISDRSKAFAVRGADSRMHQPGGACARNGAAAITCSPPRAWESRLARPRNSSPILVRPICRIRSLTPTTTSALIDPFGIRTGAATRSEE